MNRRKPLQNLPRYLAVYGKSMTALADAAGVKLSTICHVVNGTRPRWDTTTIEKILVALPRLVPGKRMSAGQLLDLEPYPRRRDTRRTSKKRPHDPGRKVEDRFAKRRSTAVKAVTIQPPPPPEPTPAELGLRVASINTGRTQ